MNNTHTPGPWEVWTDPGIETRDLSVGPVNGGVAVADIVTTNAHGIATTESISTGHANAALIAAAPDLLEALERVVQITEIEDAHLANFWEFEAARAAIAKARGGR